MGDEEKKSNLSKDEMKEVHEYYKHYRGAAIALSATVIAISGSLIYWLTGNFILKNFNDLSKCENLLVGVQLLMFGISITFAVFVQYYHFKGYFHFARIYFNQSTSEDSNKNFNCMDHATDYGVLALLIGLIFTAIFYICKYL